MEGDRWVIYSLLKGHGKQNLTEQEIEGYIKQISISELQEGVIEFLLAKKKYSMHC